MVFSLRVTERYKIPFNIYIHYSTSYTGSVGSPSPGSPSTGSAACHTDIDPLAHSANTTSQQPCLLFGLTSNID